MFLPVLLVRDYGQAGFWVFAVPNVVGAAAMGWVLRRGGASEEMVREHGGAGVAFSIVTIAFHLYVAGWVTRELTGAFALGLVVAAVVFFVTHHRPWRETWAGVIVWGVSLGIAGVFLARAGVPEVGWGGGKASADVWPLAVSCLFGFALCPYLDLTFHRARQGTNAAGARVAFGVGFGVVFFAMILFTLIYAPRIVAVVDRGAVERGLALLVGAHLTVQSGLTLAYHYQAIEERVAAGGKWLGVLGLAVVVSLLAGVAVRGLPGAFGLTAGEIGYRVFLGAYGLFFPAYVWLRIVPGRKVSMGVYWAACAVALPMFFTAFVVGWMWWVVGGVGVVVGAKAVGKRE